MKSFCLWAVFILKQQFTMFHLWLKLQAFILETDEVIISFGPVRFIYIGCNFYLSHTV
jgi:hypothetical protein